MHYFVPVHYCGVSSLTPQARAAWLSFVGSPLVIQAIAIYKFVGLKRQSVGLFVLPGRAIHHQYPDLIINRSHHLILWMVEACSKYL